MGSNEIDCVKHDGGVHEVPLQYSGKDKCDVDAREVRAVMSGVEREVGWTPLPSPVSHAHAISVPDCFQTPHMDAIDVHASIFCMPNRCLQPCLPVRVQCPAHGSP